MSSWLRTAAATACALVLAACGDRATGDADQIVVGADPAVWERVEQQLRQELEPTPFALSGERAFQLTHADPTASSWDEERLARQLLLIGTSEDPWINEALDRWRGPAPQVPSRTEVADVWANGQHVLVLLLPAEGPEAALRQEVAELKNTYVQHYREYVVERMYFPEGPDQALADTIRSTASFELRVPESYDWSRRGDVLRFAPAAVQAGAPSLNVTVTWQTPIPPGARSEPLALLEWREQVAAEHYVAPQTVEPTAVRGGTTTHRGSLALQLMGTWTGAGNQRGPFILRTVMCPIQDRMYLLDGWLHAAGQEGHEHMVEIESVLNSFRCGSAGR